MNTKPPRVPEDARLAVKDLPPALQPEPHAESHPWMWLWMFVVMLLAMCAGVGLTLGFIMAFMH